MRIVDLEVENFRTLEHVSLKDLSQFNVLIGRNNSGKSAILAVMGALREVLLSQRNLGAADVTWGDTTRVIRVRIRLRLDADNRGDSLARIGRMVGLSDERLSRLAASEFLREVVYHFQSVPGAPHHLHLQELRITDEQGEWAHIYKLDPGAHQATDAPQGQLVQVAEALASHEPLLSQSFSLGSPVIDAPVGGAGLSYNWSRSIAISPQDDRFWPMRILMVFLQAVFSFSPYRRSQPTVQVIQQNSINPTGDNLAAVVHTVLGSDLKLFRAIERFVQDALPDVGNLQSPLEGSATYVAFRVPPANYLVRLHDMGGGIEQLLTVATLLLTTKPEGALCLEEPESHLHPAAQRYLAERLRADGRQIFVTTHSAVFVDSAPDRRTYRVGRVNDVSTIAALESVNDLQILAEELGIRSSDVLLSDAVVFVEGIGDEEAWRLLASKTGQHLIGRNINVVSLGGADRTLAAGPVLSDALERLHERTSVPHLFVLDRDERMPAVIAKLQQRQGAKLVFLQRRELENYLLAPAVILAAMRAKYARSPDSLALVDNLTDEHVALELRNAAAKQFGRIAAKRTRYALGGLVGGAIDRNLAEQLSLTAESDDYGAQVARLVGERIGSWVKSLEIERVSTEIRDLLRQEWANPDRHLELAPGSELLEAAFQLVGGHYNKPADTIRLVENTQPNDVHDELKAVLKLASALL